MTGKHSIGRYRIRSQREIATALHVRVEGHLIALMTPTPPTLAIPHLVYRNAVNPRSERGLTSKSMNRPKDAQENFLREI
jgi:hypothetical protein